MSSMVTDITVPGRPEIQEVSGGIYAYVQPDGTWWINNTGFLAGPQGVISIDTCSTQRRTQAYRDAIAAVTGAPVRTVINTHHHGDHTHGNWMLPGATIVAHDRCRDEILTAGLPYFPGIFQDVDWGEVRVAPPFLTYSEGVTLYSGDLRCEVRYAGSPAHTNNDSIVWIPDRSGIHTIESLVVCAAVPTWRTWARRSPACTAIWSAKVTNGGSSWRSPQSGPSQNSRSRGGPKAMASALARSCPMIDAPGNRQLPKVWSPW